MPTILLTMLALSALAMDALAKDITGTSGDDLITGTPEADRIMALEGLDGGPGDDELFAGAGNDIVEGGPGDDYRAARPQRGRDLARQLCSSCHLVSPEQHGPVPDGIPSLMAIATRPA